MEGHSSVSVVRSPHGFPAPDRLLPAHLRLRGFGGLLMPEYEGRLELTWTNKPLRLLAHEDGSYEWVSPSDYRVAEVRLLHDITTVEDVGKVRAADNLLIQGDALNALTS